MWRYVMGSTVFIGVMLSACGESASRLPSSPSASPSANASSNAPGDWDSVLAAARKEGKFSLVGPSGSKGDVLMQGFTQQYGISIDYLGLQASEIGPKIST